MNEGGLIKLYVEREKLDKSNVAKAVDMPEEDLEKLYESQTVEPEIKKKLSAFFNRNIFDGTLLMEQSKYPNSMPDQNMKKEGGK